MTDHDRNSELAVREAMVAQFVHPPEYAAARAAVAEVVSNVAVRKDNEAPWGENNRAKCRAVLITGLTRTGKTELADQLSFDLPDLRSVDGVEILHRPFSVECPSTFSQRLLFNLILKAMLSGAGSNRLLPGSAAYDRIDCQLPVHKPTLLVIDEFQYAAYPRGVSAKRLDGVVMETLGFIRHLLDHAKWPLPILLVGLPEIDDQLDDPRYQFLNEKITRIRVAPMVQGSVNEIERLRAALAAYCAEAGVNNAIVDEDFFKRLIHATDNARGLALELCQTSVMAAWRAGRRDLQTFDFAERYRLSTGAPDDQNPFRIHGWHNTDRSRLAKRSQVDATKAQKTKQ